MKWAKFFVIAINICFLVLSVVTISAASTPRFTFGEYFTVLTTGNDIGSLHLIWIGGGFFLMAVGIFGLWSALKESTFMINLYTVILSFVLILQIVTATTSNTVSNELDYVVSNSLKRLMVQYGYNYEFTSVMDSIQKEYKCCGSNGPYDWHLLEQFTTTKRTTKKRALESTEPTILGELELPNRDDMQEILEKSPPSPPNKLSLPTSCCKDKKCKNHHSRGCFNPLYNDIAHVVFMVTSVSMFSSLLQIFGLLAAYIFGRTLRFQKANRATHIQR